MTDPQIVVGVDGSPGSRSALAWALDEARLRGAAVTVLHAWHVALGAAETFTPLASGILVGLPEDDAKALLAELVGQADTSGVAVVEQRPVCEGATAALLEAGRGADLLVVGARSHHGLPGAVLGSVADDVARQAPCPVAVVPPARPSEPAAPSPEEVTTMPRVVVGIDGSTSGEAALRVAIEEARLRHADLEVVHAIHVRRTDTLPLGAGGDIAEDAEDEGKDWLDSVLAGFDHTGIPRVEGLLARGDPAHALLRYAEGAEVLVVGTRGRGAIASAVLGSVSRHVLHHAKCPVIVVPAPAGPSGH